MRLGAGKLFQFQRFVVGQDAVGDETVELETVSRQSPERLRPLG